MEIKDVTRCAFMAPDPKLLTIDLTAHEQRMTQMRTERDTQPVRSEGPAEELRKLRREFFNLTERAKNAEIYTNNKAGEVKLLEQRIANLLTLKKAAVEMGNLRGERTYENSIERLETELGSAEVEFHRARRVSAGAANDLKSWPHRERVTELEKLVG